jgi:hypothetical protein
MWGPCKMGKSSNFQVLSSDGDAGENPAFPTKKNGFSNKKTLLFETVKKPILNLFKTPLRWGFALITTTNKNKAMKSINLEIRASEGGEDSKLLVDVMKDIYVKTAKNHNYQ